MSSVSLNFQRLMDGSDRAIGIVASVVLHGLLLLIIMHHWQPEKEQSNVKAPRFIEAKLLQMEPAIAQPKPKPKAEQKPKVDVAAQRRAEEKKKADQVKREQQARAEADRQRKEEAKKQQMAKEKELQRQQQLKKEAEQKRQQELEKQQALARQKEATRQQELAAALALEEEMLESEMDSQVGTYVDYMASLIASNWSRPPSARRGMEVELHITLASAGRVVGVEVAKSSGNPAFDRSAEQAVWKVSQFSRLKEMDPALYQRDFRKITLVFRPDDLRM